MKFLHSGQVLLSPRTQELHDMILQLRELKGKPILLRAASDNSTTKGVLLRYPLLMPISPILKNPLVLSAERLTTRDGEETRQVLITVRGPLPGTLELGNSPTKHYRYITSTITPMIPLTWNRNGQHLAEVLATVPEATLLNTIGEPTHIDGGILDLSFTSPDLSHGAKWKIHDHLASDHFATVSTIICAKPPAPAFVPRWNTKQADWPRFHTELLHHLSLTEPGLTVDDRERRLVDAFHHAVNVAIPGTKKPKYDHKDHWYYDHRVQEYNHRVNQARKLNRAHKTQDTSDLLRAAIRMAREGKRKIKTEKWLEWCSGMNAHTNLSDLWKQVKIASGRKTPATPTHPDPEREASTLLRGYVDRASSAQLSPASRAKLDEQRPAQDALIQRACNLQHQADTAFTPQELQRALRPRPDTAAGADKITYSMIRHGEEAVQEELLTIINTSNATGLLPTSWKEATIHPIPKLKDPEKTRPISLFSCLGKTAEKMVLHRLQWVTGPLHANVFAYTRNVGTRDCLLDMITSISGRKAVIIFLDMEKAFELANARPILTALARKGVAGKLLAWVQDFLTGRKARVRFQGRLTDYKTLDNGTPQGSILSPYLFNTLMEELISLPLSTGSKILCYADDIAVITTGPNHLKKAQNIITTVAKKCDSLGLKINFAKSKAMYVNVKAPPERAQARLKTLRAITAIEGGANLRLFYVQAVRSLVDYAAPLLASISPWAMEKLEKLQNQALRIMLGAPRWAKLVNMRVEADLPLLAHRVHDVNVALLAKMLVLPKFESAARRPRQSLAHDEDLFSKKNWASTSAQGVKTLQMQTTLASRASDAQHPEYAPPSPWEASGYNFSVTKLTANKSSLTADALAAQAQQALHAVDGGNKEVYFTDGSIDPDTHRAAAAFVHSTGTGIFRLPDHSSTLQTELVAIWKAIEDARLRNGDVLIHTDSLGAIQCLQRTHTYDNILLVTTIHASAQALQRENRNITINWIPSHTAIPGNDKADAAAKDARLLPTITCHVVPSRAQISNTSKKICRQLCHQAVAHQVAEGSPSASWYTTATHNTTPPDSTLPRHTHTRLHRLRLGYQCLAELNNTLPLPCEHCNTPTHAPLRHYIEDCPHTAQFLNRQTHDAPHILQQTHANDLIQLVNVYRPPR
ncbi:uncharacterized protein LOC123500673 [Portunus trituberculatus]|uniref:uncharacterized protein LOC123500673 n=1 Tax=Portunus trituberculatus TaxID=210409 RepID=UPI001E1CEF79|nr:uncharacterized protein LOC123500673 [Portunus trituberculatus]